MFLNIYVLPFLMILSGTTINPIDQHATAETRRLYTILGEISKNPNQILFGQHKATMTGLSGGHSPYKTSLHNANKISWSFTEKQVNQNYPDELCDVKGLTGDYPAVIGFDLGDFSKNAIQKYLIEEAANRGLIITVSWHMRNPISGGLPWITNDHANISHAIKRLLVNGDHHANFTSLLHKAASFLSSLRYSNGKRIPVIFRPFHEMDGGWFWWGTSKTTHNAPDDFKHLYRLTVHHLKDSLNVHNLLYAYSPSKTLAKEEYLRFYPGNNFVDVLGQDYYFSSPFQPPVADLKNRIEHICSLAQFRNKIPALTEIGISTAGLNSHHAFWTDHVLAQISSVPNTTGLAYMMAWMNSCGTNCDVRVPYKGHVAASAFLSFYYNPTTIFGSNLNLFSINSPIIG